MTSMNDIEREVDDLSADVFGDLSPDDRAVLSLQLWAAGEGEKAERVKEAAPTKTYKAQDLEFQERASGLLLRALTAFWRLDVGAWGFLYERSSGQLRAANYEQFPDEDWTEEPMPANEFHERPAKEAAVRFLADYLAWKRYAEEDIGVSLDKFLLHASGPSGCSKVDLIETVAQMADGRLFTDRPDADQDRGWAAGTTVEYDGEDFTAEELAEKHYRTITTVDEVAEP